MQAMRRWVAALSFALIACSQQAAPIAHVSVSSSAQASPSPAGKPGYGLEPTGTPFIDLPVSPVAFSCRIPVYKSVANGVEDYFVTFPSGTATADPNGVQGMYFDRAYSSWVPV